MKELKTILYILSIIAVPMLTTLLLNLQFIQQFVIRQILVYALILIQILALILMFVQYLKKQ